MTERSIERGFLFPLFPKRKNFLKTWGNKNVSYVTIVESGPPRTTSWTSAFSRRYIGRFSLPFLHRRGGHSLSWERTCSTPSSGGPNISGPTTNTVNCSLCGRYWDIMHMRLTSCPGLPDCNPFTLQQKLLLATDVRLWLPTADTWGWPQSSATMPMRNPSILASTVNRYCLRRETKPEGEEGNICPPPG